MDCLTRRFRGWSHRDLFCAGGVRGGVDYLNNKKKVNIDPQKEGKMQKKKETTEVQYPFQIPKG